MKFVARITFRCILLSLISWSLVSQTFNQDIDWRLMSLPLLMVIIPFPNNSHRFAMGAAVAAHAALSYGKFWEFYRTLFEKQASLNDDTIQSIAVQLAPDMTKFNQDLRSQHLKAMVKRDLREGRQIGINVTTAVFINGKY